MPLVLISFPSSSRVSAYLVTSCFFKMSRALLKENLAGSSDDVYKMAGCLCLFGDNKQHVSKLECLRNFCNRNFHGHFLRV